MKYETTEKRKHFNALLATLETCFNASDDEQQELINESLCSTLDLIDEDLPDIEDKTPKELFTINYDKRFNSLQNFHILFSLTEHERTIFLVCLAHSFPWLHREDSEEVNGSDTIDLLTEIYHSLGGPELPIHISEYGEMKLAE